MERFLQCFETLVGFHENVLMGDMVLFESMDVSLFESLKDDLEVERDSLEDKISEEDLERLEEIIERLDALIESITELEKIAENNDLEKTIDDKFSKIKMEFLKLKKKTQK